MVVLRTFVLFVVALAVAVAPAAPCTMAHAAAAHRHADHAKPAVSPEAGRHVHHDHGEASRPSAPFVNVVASERGSPAVDLSAARSTSQEPGCPEHRQRAHKGPCLAACCTLAGQVALPTASWSGACLEAHSSDRVLIAQEDGVVDAHPTRIERPPRLGA
ncbi:hypothetical protein AO398_03790 [Methylobacterium sp. GXS13]|uniref:hypothetical protein n=1 Tax=unclassified Methylobacterium TaxID=2615210 RepID=UPI00071B7631|nr:MULTISPECIES: hypothetical protein [unclassified Methylobacterium]KST60009.1 hypothetical protein AO398_03790 [Methylobacterium sp. GXS13]MCJ2102330.1 hypothetical protein [Methylobacterium sp. E-046]